MDLTKFQNVFGEPYKGIHAFRFLGLAAVDLFGTLLLVFLFYHRFWTPKFWGIFLVVFVTGELFHWIFGVNTAFLKFFTGLIYDGSTSRM